LNIEKNNFGIQIKENTFVIWKHKVKWEYYVEVSILGKFAQYIETKRKRREER
jgi:hypothetical protein